MPREDIFEKINELSAKAPENRHSYFQLKYFILGKEPTTQAQLWQCLTQLQGKKETIDAIAFQIEDTKDDIELLNIEKEELQIQVCPTIKNADQRKLAIQLRKIERKIKSLIDHVNKLDKKLEFEVQEARFYIQAFEALEKKEPLKDFDDFDAQKEYWEATIAEDLNLRLILRQPLPVDTVKTALNLHEGSPTKQQLTKLLENFSKLQVEIPNKEKDESKQITRK